MPNQEIPKKNTNYDDMTSNDDDLRSRAVDLAKDFKTSWKELGQVLYAIHQDKLYKKYGFEKFDNYTQKELGLKNQTAMKMLKSYLFVEDDEPAYLKEDFALKREANKVPSLDEINLLRMAKNKKELLHQDYEQLKKSVFDKGKDVSLLRKDLTALIRERKPVDPETEKEKILESSLKKLIASLTIFSKDMSVYKLVPFQLIEEAKELTNKLKEQLSK